MKKLLLITAFLIGMYSLSNAQDISKFAKGDQSVYAGVGFGYQFDQWGAVSSLPEFGLGYDMGIMDFNKIGVLSVGGFIGYKYTYTSVDDAYGKAYKWSWNSYIIAARGKIHLTYLKIQKIDLYGGASLGVRITKGNITNSLGLNPLNNSVSPIVGIFGGAQYNFNRNFGVYSELGFDVAYLTVGINYRF